jgi:hypothetical protein
MSIGLVFWLIKDRRLNLATFQEIEGRPDTVALFLSVIGLVVLAIWKFRRFWSPIYNPVAPTYAYGTGALRQYVHCIFILPLLVLFPIALADLIRSRPSVALLFFGIIAFYTAAHMVAMGYSRLRLPLDPLLIIVVSTLVSKALSRYRPALSNTPA